MFCLFVSLCVEQSTAVPNQPPHPPQGGGIHEGYHDQQNDISKPTHAPPPPPSDMMTGSESPKVSAKYVANY